MAEFPQLLLACALPRWAQCIYLIEKWLAVVAESPMGCVMFVFEKGVRRRTDGRSIYAEEAIPNKIRERDQVKPRSRFLKRQKRIRATIPGQAVTPPWQPPPFLVSAFSVHPVD